MKLLSKGAWYLPNENRPWQKWRDLRYRATFWDSEAKRHYDRDCDDILIDLHGERRLANTAPGVSYHRELMRAAA